MTNPEYIELHARSAFSFLEGASIPEELIYTAHHFNMPAMALLDRNGFYGSPRFHLAAKKNNVRALIGAEITAILEPDLKPGRLAAPFCVNIPLLVQNRKGYQNLCRLITLIKLRTQKISQPGEVAATLDELREHSEGLICLTGDEDGPLARALGSTGDLAGENFTDENLADRDFTDGDFTDGDFDSRDFVDRDLADVEARSARRHGGGHDLKPGSESHYRDEHGPDAQDRHTGSDAAVGFGPAGFEKAVEYTKRLIDVFGRGNVYAELQRHFNREEEARNH